jgi:hypothetical protein
MLSPGTPTAPKAIESALCTRDLLTDDAHGEAKGLTASSPEWNRQQAAPNAERVAKRYTLMTSIRHARQCRDYFWRACCLQ